MPMNRYIILGIMYSDVLRSTPTPRIFFESGRGEIFSALRDTLGPAEVRNVVLMVRNTTAWVVFWLKSDKRYEKRQTFASVSRPTRINVRIKNSDSPCISSLKFFSG